MLFASRYLLNVHLLAIGVEYSVDAGDSMEATIALASLRTTQLAKGIILTAIGRIVRILRRSGDNPHAPVSTETGAKRLSRTTGNSRPKLSRSVVAARRKPSGSPIDGNTTQAAGREPGPESTEPIPETNQPIPESNQVIPESKPGRRVGSKNLKRDEVDVVVSRCKGCDSTRRLAYGHPIVQLASGTDVNGKPFTHMIARPTACRDCGQARRDISYEYHPKKTADQVANDLAPKPKRKR